MKLTKQGALKKIEELKKYVSDEETKEKGYIIRNRYDESEIYVSTKDNVRDAVIEAIESKANLTEANLTEADLTEADLTEAELNCAKFYGKGGNSKLKKDQVEDFLNALGFQVV